MRTAEGGGVLMSLWKDILTIDNLLHALLGMAIVVSFKPYLKIGFCVVLAFGLARECWQQKAWPWELSAHKLLEAAAWSVGGVIPLLINAFGA